MAYGRTISLAVKRIAQGWGNSLPYRILSLLERQLLSLGLLGLLINFLQEQLLNPRKKASKQRNSYLSQAIEVLESAGFLSLQFWKR